jgi:hypothetical protein
MSRVSIVAAATPTKIPIIVGQNVCDTTKAPDIPPCRAKGDANPDFLRPLHDRIRRDAVDTDRRHHQRGQGKKAEQKRAVALGAQGNGDALVHRDHFIDHDVGIDCPNRLSHLGREPKRITLGSSQDEGERAPRDVKARHLCKRRNEEWLRRLAKRSVRHVLGHADDGKGLRTRPRRDPRAKDAAIRREPALESLARTTPRRPPGPTSRPFLRTAARGESGSDR